MKREEVLEIYKLEHARFNSFREIQWKMNVTFWTVIILGIAQVEIISRLNWYEIVVLSLLIFIAHLIFVVRTQLSLEASIKIERHIENELNDGLKDNISLDKTSITQKVRIRRRGWHWLIFQLLATAVLLIVFLLLVTNFKLEILSCH